MQDIFYKQILCQLSKNNMSIISSQFPSRLQRGTHVRGLCFFFFLNMTFVVKVFHSLKNNRLPKNSLESVQRVKLTRTRANSEKDERTQFFNVARIWMSLNSRFWVGANFVKNRAYSTLAEHSFNFCYTIVVFLCTGWDKTS